MQKLFDEINTCFRGNFSDSTSSLGSPSGSSRGIAGVMLSCLVGTTLVAVCVVCGFMRRSILFVTIHVGTWAEILCSANESKTNKVNESIFGKNES